MPREHTIVDALNRRVETTEKNMKALHTAIRVCERWESKRRHSEQLEDVATLVSHTYDRAMAYTNLIIAAGYVGFFTAWTTLEPRQLDFWHNVAGLLMLVSLFVFAIWEVFKMVWTTYFFRQVIPLLDADGPAQANDNLQRIKRVESALNLWVGRFWFWALCATVGPGVTAGILLMVVFGIQIVQGETGTAVTTP